MQATTGSAIDHHSRILLKTQHLIDMIQSTDAFVRYKQAEHKLNRHPDGQALLFLVKAKRNAYSQTSLRHGYDHPASQKAKQEYDEILRQIEQIPLIEEYQVSQEDLNELLQGVARTIINTLSPDVRTEIYDHSAGGGCGTGGCGGSCSTR